MCTAFGVVLTCLISQNLFDCGQNGKNDTYLWLLQGFYERTQLAPTNTSCGPCLGGCPSVVFLGCSATPLRSPPSTPGLQALPLPLSLSVQHEHSRHSDTWGAPLSPWGYPLLKGYSHEPDLIFSKLLRFQTFLPQFHQVLMAPHRLSMVRGPAPGGCHPSLPILREARWAGSCPTHPHPSHFLGPTRVVYIL